MSNTGPGVATEPRQPPSGSQKTCDAATKPQRKPRGLRHIILNFTPSWFSVTMGIGIVSLLLYTAPHKFRHMDDIGVTLYLANCTLFTLFTVLSIARFTMYPQVLGQMLAHPVQSLFVGTVPMGLATIVNATALVAVHRYGQWALTLAWTLWWIDVVLSVMSCYGMPCLMFHVHSHKLDKMTGAWLLPVVPTVVAAASGAVLAPYLSPQDAVTTIVTSYALLGSGLGMSLLVLAMYVHRLAICHLPEAEVILSAFLPLGPLGQGGYAVIQLAQAGRTAFTSSHLLGETEAISAAVVAGSNLAGIMMWGFGTWWLTHGMYCVIVRRLQARLKFNMGWWGFIFPLGVWINCTYALAKTLPSPFLSWVAIVALCFLVVLFVVVLFGTIKGAITQQLFVAPCLGPDLKVPPQSKCSQASLQQENA